MSREKSFFSQEFDLKYVIAILFPVTISNKNCLVSYSFRHYYFKRVVKVEETYVRHVVVSLIIQQAYKVKGKGRISVDSWTNVITLPHWPVPCV